MQQKKKEVRKQIEKAALSVFFKKGYTDAKMGDIAKEVGMSVGNIYTYFENKETLFYTVIPDNAVAYLETIITDSINRYNECYYEGKDMTDLSLFMKQQIDIVITYRMEIVIMLDRNVDTKYEGLKEKIANLMVETKMFYLSEEDHKAEEIDETKQRVIEIISKNVIQLVIDVLKEEMPDNSRRHIFYDLNIYQLEGITGLNRKYRLI